MSDDAARLAALESFDILDTEPEQGFDDIVLLATNLCATPVALVSLVARDRQWFKARVGFEACETPLDQSVCANALYQPGMLIIPDLTLDPRTRENTLVTKDPHIRFYAGARLETVEGQVLGTLCVIDLAPRPGGLTDAQAAGLQALARQVMALLEMRRALMRHAYVRQSAWEAELRQQQILDSSTDFAIITTDRDGLITSWNAGASLIFGWSETDVIGQPASILYTLEDCAAGRPAEEGRAAIRHGRAPDERWHVKRDGSRFYARGTVTPLVDASEKVVGFLKILRDRTEQRKAAEILRETQALNTLILNSSRDCIMVLDLDGHIQFVSQGGTEVMEIADPDELTGTSWLNVWRETKAMAKAAFGEARSGRTGRFQGFLPTFKGTPKWWDVIVSPLVGADGSPDRLVSVGRDITALKQAEAALQEVNATLEVRVADRTRERDRIWQVSRDPLGVADIDGIWLSVNPAWTHILGWQPGEIIGRNSEWIEHPDDRMVTVAAFANLGDGQTTLEFENRLRTRDGGYRTLSWTTVFFEGLLYCVARDITVQKEQQAALTRTEEQLRQSQKMEAVGQLTGGLAHDFNNLLTGIIGSLELIKRRVAQERYENVDRYATAAQGAATRAATLTHRLLAFSRRQTLDPKPTDPNRLIAGMEDLIRRTVGPEISLKTAMADNLWLTLCDPNQLENAILNLCINARDAMPNGGCLVVETNNTSVDESQAKVLDLPPGSYVSMSVSDTGTGMTAEVAARAFDPFFTTKPMGQGTGLGLSMIYGFARQSGGQVRIHSAVDQGTTMRIYLPRHTGDEEPEPVQPARSIEPPRAASGETVLIVDDERTVRMLVAEVLEELGYAAIEAADGAAGLDVLRSGARVDLLVTDVGLPGGMNGRQVADAGRALRPDLKILFITGYAESVIAVTGVLDPGMHVMTKPFAMDALAGRIKQIISAR